MDNEQTDWIFRHKIMVCDNCEYRGKNTVNAYKHLIETGHKGFHDESFWELDWIKKDLT